MKSIIAISTIIFAVSTNVQANATCESLHEFATSLMEIRQLGVSMPEAMSATEGHPVLKSIVMDAYKVPKYRTEEMQQSSITEFGNEVYLGCMRAFSGDGE